MARITGNNHKKHPSYFETRNWFVQTATIKKCPTNLLLHQLNLKAVCGDADDLRLHSVLVTAEEPGCPPVAVALWQQHIEHRVYTGVQILQHSADEVKQLPGLSMAIQVQVHTQLQHITRQPAHWEGSSSQEHHDRGAAGVPGTGHRHYRALVEKMSQSDIVEGND